MKKVIFLFLVTLAYWSSHGQCTQGNCQTNIPIANGNNWSESHGTPTWGNNSVWLWSYQIAGNGFNVGGEGVNYSGFNFVQGEQYCVSFTLAADTNTGNLPANNVSMNVILTQNAVVGTTGSNTNNPIPATPNPNQVLMNQNIWNSVPNTQTYTFNFTANQNFNNIWFFPQNPNAPNPQIEVSISNLSICNACDPTDSPAFDIDISCDNGNKCVTVTSNDPDISNHWWGLMEIDDYNSPNDTSDANTADGDGDASNGISPVTLITGQNSATFCGLNLGKRYYVKHGIWDPGCYNWRETRTPVPNFDAEAIFHFEDENETIKTTFCYGEDVYMNGTASYGENRYFIDAWRRPIGSTQNFNWYAGLGWTTNAMVGTLNLSDMFSNLNPSKAFEPGYEYEIKLAIANLEDCVGWTPITHTFTVECCDDFLNAKFESSQNTLGNIDILSFDQFDNIDATHEWFVVSSPNQNGGPYTQVLSTTSSGPAPFTLVFNSQPGLFYTVIHRVKTLCGEVCSANVHYFVQGVAESVPVVDQDIEDGCRLIDEVFPKCEELATPTNLQVNGTTLSWDPVPGATSYIISSPGWNDPQVACKCRNLASIYITTDQTSHTISNSLASKCFIWQVTAVCEDETQSQASQQMCFYPVFVTPDEPNDGEVAQVAVSPNPNNGEFTINIDISYDSNISVEVYDFYGQVVKTFIDTAKAGNSKSINWNGAGTLRQGIYILEIKTDREVIYKKMIVK